MELEDKIYYLQDILDLLEKDGYDKKAIEAGYYDFLERFENDLANTDNTVYKLGSFASLFFTIQSLQYLRKLAHIQKNNASEKGEERKEKDAAKKLEVLYNKLDVVLKLTDEAKKNSKGKSIPFFRIRKKKRKIRNGD